MHDYTDSQQLLLSPTHLSFPQVYKDAARCTETFERWQVGLDLSFRGDAGTAWLNMYLLYCVSLWGWCHSGCWYAPTWFESTKGLRGAIPNPTPAQYFGSDEWWFELFPISPGRGRGWSSESEAVHTPSDWSPPLAVMERRQGVHQPNIVRVSSECDGRRLLISVTTFGAFLLRAVFSES